MILRSYRWAAMLLNLGLPGLGHVFCREYLFGVFIFLIMLITAVLFFVSFFLSLSFWPKAILLILPSVFYIFTFVDLHRVTRLKRESIQRTSRALMVFLVVAIAYQTLAPVAPGNFVLRNYPRPFVLSDNSLSPLFSRGDLLKASRLEYSVNLFFVQQPVYHTLPARFDPVRFADTSGVIRNGIVIGLPGEEIQMVDGVLVINGSPVIDEPGGGLILLGDCPLTYIDNFSIATAALRLGAIDKIYLVPLQSVVGKVEKVF
ncbi:MAG: hypothetical protein JSV52_02225 [Candidatus Zixiibacteriota bacterium]|nr:MAG: hypothetical protein JSV52_02225 [candidate division Zixibacteria bacterium]